jgi:SAM-dependent methyltransferase
MTEPGPPRVPGTAGYGQAAEMLARQYEGVDFAWAYRSVLHALPSPPADLLDIGAGTGRDAAEFARRGYRVVAVEPTPEFRQIGQRLHGALPIEWLDDALPELAAAHALDRRFALVSLIAVWMHLDAAERARAMPRVAQLLQPGGLLVMSLRHGPVPPGRRMFAVGADETRALAAADGLTLMHQGSGPDMLGREGVTLTLLAFRRSDGYAL